MNLTQSQSQADQESLTAQVWDNKTPACRICERDEGELISPCMCEGRFAYIHSTCLAQQIERRRIMEVAEIDGVYNFRCSCCKFHIQFVIQEQHFQLSIQGISQALKSLNEDSAASLGLNISLAILVFTIMTVTLMGHLKAGSQGHWSLNCKVACLELLLAYLECFLLHNIARSFPFKTRRPIPLVCLTN